jgi:SAM-dependent methyltransferase
VHSEWPLPSFALTELSSYGRIITPFPAVAKLREGVPIQGIRQGESLIAETFLWMTRWSPRLRRSLWRGLFELLAGKFRDVTWWQYMNYGFAPLEAQDTAPVLQPADEPDRYAINLYHHVATGAPIEGQEVLEVGCGRGGGSSYIARYLKPARMVGVDISQNAIEFCRKVHRAPNLKYRHGDAEALPFPDGSFDAVVNVESSFCYGSFDGFIAEVARVLRPGGYLLLADIRLANETEELDAAMARSGLRLVSRRDSTQNVVEALARDSERRTKATGDRIPKPFRKMFNVFLGVEGTRMPVHLRSREMIYLSYCLQKPGAAAMEQRHAEIATAAAM